MVSIDRIDRINSIDRIEGIEGVDRMDGIYIKGWIDGMDDR